MGLCVCAPAAAPLEVGPWEGALPGPLAPALGREGIQGCRRILVSPPLSLHQFSGKFCGYLSHYLKPGWTEEGRAEVWGSCGKSETVPSSSTVTAGQPHPTLVHRERAPKSGLDTETPSRTKDWPMPAQNNPQFSVRTLKAQFLPQASPGPLQEPNLQG